MTTVEDFLYFLFIFIPLFVIACILLNRYLKKEQRDKANLKNNVIRTEILDSRTNFRINNYGFMAAYKEKVTLVFKVYYRDGRTETRKATQGSEVFQLLYSKLEG